MTPPPTNPNTRANTEYGITTRDLNLWYAKFQALINVTVNIKKGIITSLIGPMAAARPRCSAVAGSTNATAMRRQVIKLGKISTTRRFAELAKRGHGFQRPNPLPISVYERRFGLRIQRRQPGDPTSTTPSSPHRSRFVEDLKDRLQTKATVSSRTTAETLHRPPAPVEAGNHPDG
jgi:ABC-type phosphate transport system ATPase subunit